MYKSCNRRKKLTYHKRSWYYVGEKVHRNTLTDECCCSKPGKSVGKQFKKKKKNEGETGAAMSLATRWQQVAILQTPLNSEVSLAKF